MMDDKTRSWLIDQIDQAPTKECLNGIRYTLEYFYSIDKDIDTFEFLIKRINEGELHKTK